MDIQTGANTYEVCWVLYHDDLTSAEGFYQSEVIQASKIKIEGREYIPASYLILCPDCGTVWARRYTVEPQGNWKCKRWPCRDCGNGSLWDSWNEPWNKSLSTELLIREMDILSDWWEQGIRTHLQYFQHKHFKRKV